MTDRRHTLFPFLLVLYEISIYLSMDAYMPALPEIAHVFGVTTSTAQFTVIFWMLGGLSLQVLVGPLSDRYGRRPMILFGGVLYVVSTVLCAISPNVTVMLIGRFFQGMAMPTMYIAGYAAVNEWFDSKEAIKMLAHMNSITILAPAFGPLLGGMFLLFFSWRWIFVILALMSAVSVTLLFYKMPETLSDERASKKHTFIEVMQQYKSVVSNRRFILLSVVTFFPIVGLISWMLAGPFMIVQQLHYSTFIFGVIQGFIFGSFILGTRMVSRYANKLRNNYIVNVGLVFCVLGSLLVVLVDWISPYSLIWTILCIMLATFGSGLTMPILSRLTLETSDEPMGIKVTVFSVMRILFPGMIGAGSIVIFYNNTLMSIGMIMLVFALIATATRVLDYAFLKRHP